jgi:hypothetical protein
MQKSHSMRIAGTVPVPISREITLAGKRAFWWFGGV